MIIQLYTKIWFPAPNDLYKYLVIPLNIKTFKHLTILALNFEQVQLSNYVRKCTFWHLSPKGLLLACPSMHLHVNTVWSESSLSLWKNFAALDMQLGKIFNHTALMCTIIALNIGTAKPLQTVFLFVLRFYGPVNPMGSCRARSVYLTTRLLGRLSPLSG